MSHCIKNTNEQNENKGKFWCQTLCYSLTTVLELNWLQIKIFFHTAPNCKLKSTLKISVWKFYISLYGASRFDRVTELKVEEGEHSSGVPPEADTQCKHKLIYLTDRYFQSIVKSMR